MPPSPRRRMVSYRPRKTRPIMQRPTSLFTSGGTIETVARGSPECAPAGRFTRARTVEPSDDAHAPPRHAQAALREQTDGLGVSLALLLEDAGGEGVGRVVVADGDG